MKEMLLSLFSKIYSFTAHNFIFMFDSERVHEIALSAGYFFSKHKWVIAPFSFWLRPKNEKLTQVISGLTFKGPVGLAAGFDYYASLSRLLPYLGFGFGTVGTFTAKPYEGNVRPRLGRLIKSKALLVNKGFKNNGIDFAISRLERDDFEMPVGLSIGKTNIDEVCTQELAIEDIRDSFSRAEKSNAIFNYYELNISCPNLNIDVSFYPPENLEELLLMIDNLNLSRPVFVKMPIEETDTEMLEMLKVISKHNIRGIILGNLARSRNNPALVKEEVEAAGKGNFSGMPTQKRSDELIKLAYENFGDKLTVIGCGGVFTAEDAYRKIRNGASLVQLISGLIYSGPLLPAQINFGLARLLKKDGFKHIAEAVGVDTKRGRILKV
jgi:dihydroorotate dehydrogenase subfamily 2